MRKRPKLLYKKNSYENFGLGGQLLCHTRLWEYCCGQELCSRSIRQSCFDWSQIFNVSDLYTEAAQSSLLDMFRVENLSELQVWPISLIDRKCFRMPLENGFAIVPRRHSVKQYVCGSFLVNRWVYSLGVSRLGFRQEVNSSSSNVVLGAFNKIPGAGSWPGLTLRGLRWSGRWDWRRGWDDGLVPAAVTCPCHHPKDDWDPYFRGYWKKKEMLGERKKRAV